MCQTRGADKVQQTPEGSPLCQRLPQAHTAPVHAASSSQVPGVWLGGPAEHRRLAEGLSRSGKESRVIRSSVTESRASARIASLAAQQRWSAESPISVEKHLQTQVTCPEQTRDKQSVASLAHVTSSVVIQLRCRSLIAVAVLLRCLATANKTATAMRPLG